MEVLLKALPTIIEGLKNFFLNEKEKNKISKENEELKIKNE